MGLGSNSGFTTYHQCLGQLTELLRVPVPSAKTLDMVTAPFPWQEGPQRAQRGGHVSAGPGGLLVLPCAVSLNSGTLVVLTEGRPLTSNSVPLSLVFVPEGKPSWAGSGA